MALRLCFRRVSPLAFASRPCRAQVVYSRRAASTATAASNLPHDLKNAIEKEASLPNPDPLADSQTRRLVDDQVPYMVSTYARPPLMLAKGEGCYVWDVENRKYLDFTAGIAVNALGHCDPEITNVISQQASTLVHVSNLYFNPWIGSLSKLLIAATKASGAMQSASRVFVCNSGSEANEAALKFARKVGKQLDPSGKKTDLVSFNGSFHGRTMGALSATPNSKYQKPFSPMVPGFSYGNFNDATGLKDLITETTCGVIIEPIQGEGGVNVATPEFLTALRTRCNEVGAVLIYDEIQCGLSRTGSFWAHGTLPPEAHPDILTTAKALGNGVPVGATIVSEEVAEKIVIGDHGTTFGGNPLANRVAYSVVNRLAEPALIQSVAAKENLFRAHFERLKARFPQRVTEVRGRGLLLGLQLDSDPTKIVTAARERGLLVITCGTNTLRFVPPLIITEQQIDDGMRILESAMASVWEAGDDVPRTPGQQEMPPASRQ